MATAEDDCDEKEELFSWLLYGSNESKWMPQFGPIGWLQQQIALGTNPRRILNDIIPHAIIPPHMDKFLLWKTIWNILSVPPRRQKLTSFCTLENVVELIDKSNKIIVLTGAGVSVSCGIPDFRSRHGVYARLIKDFPDLPHPQAMFDIHYFSRDQRPFFKFAKEIYPGLIEPSISHKFIKCIEDHNKLLRNYSQNIDTLEKAAGIQRVVTCHGSFAKATCTRCRYQVDSSVIKEDIFAQRIPQCPKCPPDCEELKVMKPDIVFFGESLPDEFHNSMASDKDNCDLLIVMGSSLKVHPVSMIPNSLPPEVPQVLINREPLDNFTFDVELLGDCDVIVQEICNRLGESWNFFCTRKTLLREIKQSSLPSFPSQHKETTDCEINNNSDIESTTSSDHAECRSSTENLKNSFQGNTSDDSGPSSSSDISDEKCNHKPYEEVPEGCFIHASTGRYIFEGAEISTTVNDDDND